MSRGLVLTQRCASRARYDKALACHRCRRVLLALQRDFFQSPDSLWWYDAKAWTGCPQTRVGTAHLAEALALRSNIHGAM